MKRIVYGRAPLRVDLAGAWSDIPFYSDLYGGRTINAAISNICVNGKILLNEDGSFKFQYSLDFPSGSGLGSSGALNVLYYAMINHKKFLEGKLSKKDIAFGAYEIERALGSNCGKQDQCASAFGGINLFKFGPKNSRCNLNGEIVDDFFIKRLKIELGGSNNSDELAAFSEKLFLINTKILHSSSEIISSIQSDFESNKNNYRLSSTNGHIRSLIHKMADSCYNLQVAFRAQEGIKSNDTIDWEEVGEIISYQFDIMKRMSSKTTNEAIEKIINDIDYYIYGAKPGGAGGGGCIIVLCKSLEHKEELKKKMKKDEFLSNFNYHDVIVDVEGVKIWECNNN